MKFKIRRDYFLKGLNIASKAIGSKSAIPVLMNVKIVVSDKGLELLGSNNELTIQHIIGYQEGEEEILMDVERGGVLVNSRILNEIVRKVEGNIISLEVIDSTIIQIGDGKSVYKLNSVRFDEYPELDLSEDGVVIELSSKIFIQTINQTAFAASTKEQRPILTAVNLEADSTNGKLIVTATDSARLSQKEIDLPRMLKFNANIPARVLVDTANLIEKESNVKISFSDKKVVFMFDNTLVASRLIAGEYPKTKNIIPKTFNYTLQVNAKEIVSAIDRVSLLSIERENVVKLSITETSLEVSSRSIQIGSANEKIDIFSYRGEPFEVSFNADFVVSAIKACQSEDISIKFLGEMKPFVVRNEEDESLIQLVTPVRAY